MPSKHPKASGSTHPKPTKPVDTKKTRSSSSKKSRRTAKHTSIVPPLTDPTLERMEREVLDLCSRPITAEVYRAAPEYQKILIEKFFFPSSIYDGCTTQADRDYVDRIVGQLLDPRCPDPPEAFWPRWDGKPVDPASIQQSDSSGSGRSKKKSRKVKSRKAE